MEAAAEFGVKGLGEHELEDFCLFFLSFVFVSHSYGEIYIC